MSSEQDQLTVSPSCETISENTSPYTYMLILDAWEECLAIPINWTSHWDRKLGSDIVEIGQTGSLQWTHQVKCWRGALYFWSGRELKQTETLESSLITGNTVPQLLSFFVRQWASWVEGASGTTNTSWMPDRIYCFTTLGCLYMEECVKPPQYYRKASHVLWQCLLWSNWPLLSCSLRPLRPVHTNTVGPTSLNRQILLCLMYWFVQLQLLSHLKAH